MEKENMMKKIVLAKVTVNMGIGAAGEELKKAEAILEKITEAKPFHTKCKVKQPIWGIRPGLPIGIKVTLRKEKAAGFLKRALAAKDNILSKRNFDREGNFGFGVKEYIDLPDTKYDPQYGIKGFDVLVNLERAGYRIKRRKTGNSKVGKKQKVSKEEAIKFMEENFEIEVE